jgi:hypothetical protein
MNSAGLTFLHSICTSQLSTPISENGGAVLEVNAATAKGIQDRGSLTGIEKIQGKKEEATIT